MSLDICYVVNSVSETSVPATLGTALVEYENIDVDILAWFEAEPFNKQETIDVDCLEAGSLVGLSPKTYRSARKKLRGYDLIQVHTNHSGSLAKVIGSQLDIPLVSREGNTRDGFTRKGRIANGVTNAFADRIVPNSQAVYDSFRRWERLLIDDERVEIIPNGVDLDQIDTARAEGSDVRGQFAIPNDAIVVGTAAVISQQKALSILIKGLHRANTQTDENLHAVIAGDGPQRSEVEALVSKLGLEDRIHFPGMIERNSVYQLLAEVDIYAMPSRWEGFSMAAVEALGSETPCLFSDIGPFVQPYRNVARFHSVDDIEEFAEQLIELAEDSDLREMYAQSGRKLVEKRYTLEEIANRYSDLYKEIA
jgi:glycosyltransferase involved in cell wall biosynthesis